MLARNDYPKAYVDECRAAMERQLAAYHALATSCANAGPELDAFTPLFFNNMVVALDRFFVHRTRMLEGKDGNPLNEVRMICDALLEHDGIMSPQSPIKYDPSKSVLKLEFGDKIQLRESDFARLASAFFDEMDARFAKP